MLTHDRALSYIRNHRERDKIALKNKSLHTSECDKSLVFHSLVTNYFLRKKRGCRQVGLLFWPSLFTVVWVSSLSIFRLGQELSYISEYQYDVDEVFFVRYFIQSTKV